MQNRSQAVGQATAYAERARARGEPCATCNETASHTRMSHSKRSNVASGSRRRRGMRGSYDGRRATCTATSGWGHEKAHTHAWESVMGRHLPNRRPCTLSSQSTSAIIVPLQFRCSTTSSGNHRHLADCRPRLLPPQHTVAATPAKPSTMATGQAPCGLSGGPAEQA